MALTVENGTGLSTAESFVSVADADTRHAALGNTAWAALATAAKEQALRRATNYMQERYREAWRGTKLLRAQALAWPRYGATVDSWDIDSDVVPTEVANACADLALKASTETLSADQDRAVVREKVGPLETEYSPHSSQAKRYVAVDAALAPFLKGASNMVRLVRA